MKFRIKKQIIPQVNKIYWVNYCNPNTYAPQLYGRRKIKFINKNIYGAPYIYTGRCLVTNHGLSFKLEDFLEEIK